MWDWMGWALAWCCHISSGTVGKLLANLDLLLVRLEYFWVSLLELGWMGSGLALSYQ